VINSHNTIIYTIISVLERHIFTENNQHKQINKYAMCN
jgi:hypothetical protein